MQSSRPWTLHHSWISGWRIGTYSTMTPAYYLLTPLAPCRTGESLNMPQVRIKQDWHLKRQAKCLRNVRVNLFKSIRILLLKGCIRDWQHWDTHQIVVINNDTSFRDIFQVLEHLLNCPQLLLKRTSQEATEGTHSKLYVCSTVQQSHERMPTTSDKHYAILHPAFAYRMGPQECVGPRPEPKVGVGSVVAETKPTAFLTIM